MASKFKASNKKKESAGGKSIYESAKKDSARCYDHVFYSSLPKSMIDESTRNLEDK